MPGGWRIGYNGIVDADMVGRWMIAAGLFAALAGLALLIFSRVPFLGRLPGDISFQRGGFSLFIPLATSLVLSIVLTMAVNIAVRVFNK